MKVIIKSLKGTLVVEKGGPGSGHHGHRGRPGKRGGSLPGSKTLAIIETHFQDIYREAEEWAEIIEEPLNYDTITFVAGNKLADTNETALSEATGLPLGQVKKINADMRINSWKGASLSMQKVAFERNGGRLEDWMKDRLASASPTDSHRMLYDATKDRTVSMLKEAGIDSITIYRGMHPTSTEGLGLPLFEGATGSIVGAPLSSWSLSVEEAAKFSSKPGSVLLKMTVPVERVFSTGLTGIGSPSLQEVIVEGGVADTVTRVDAGD